MNNQMFIPELIKAGFNERSDTYSGLLAYVIYNDGKKWRKEASWENWRLKYQDNDEFLAEKRIKYDSSIGYEQKYYNLSKEEAIKKIGPFEDWYYHSNRKSNNKDIIPKEFKNEPTEGFVLNKKAGGTTWSWNTRQTYSRVYDPRGFEIEITIENLLYILECTSSIPGKALEGEFVYAWSGKDLILLPTNSPDYKEIQSYTDLQHKKFSLRDLKVGHTYLTKKQKSLLYLGRYVCHEYRSAWRKSDTLMKSTKKHWFVDKNGYYKQLTSGSSIAKEISNVLDDRTNTFIENMKYNSKYSVKTDKYNYTEVDVEDNDWTGDLWAKLNNEWKEVYYLSGYTHMVKDVKNSHPQITKFFKRKNILSNGEIER